MVTSAVTLFTPISTVAGTANRLFAIDNDTGNVFWSRQFEGDMGTGSTACPGGISGAPTRDRQPHRATAAPARGGGAGRAAQSYSSAVGEPGAGVPVQPGGGRGGGGRGAAPAAPAAGAPPPAPATAGPARGGTGPVAPAPASPFPTNPQAVAAAGGAGGDLFRSSGVVYAVSGDGKLRKLGLVSGKDVQRPADFLPAGARFSDLIAVGDLIYTTTSQPCGNAANAIWAMNVSGDPGTVTSWKTGGGSLIGSVVFTTSGTLIAAIGPGPTASGGYANAIVALDPKTLALKDWYQSPSEVTAAPIVFQDDGRDIVAATTRDGRLLLLDAASLGGADHATPLFATALTSNGTAFAVQSPAMWQERRTPAAAPAGDAPGAAPIPTIGADGQRWLLLPITGRASSSGSEAASGAVSSGAILAVKVSHQGGTYSVQPGWTSANIAAPLTPIVVNGVVFVASAPANMPAALYAVNGVTGNTLWQSGKAITAALSGHSFWIGSGQAYIGTVDGTVYAFGFAMERK